MPPVTLLDGLDQAQREAVACGEHPLAVIAAAGSGKTAVITRRIAHRVAEGTAEERHVVALTFSRQAAQELSRRLYGLGVREVTAGTFHGVAYGVLRQRWTDQGRPAPALMTVRTGLLGEAVRTVAAGRRQHLDPQALGIEIDWARAQRIAPAAYAAAIHAQGRRAPVSADLVTQAYAEYGALKRSRRVIDFDDLLESGLQEMAGDPEFAAQVRWRFRHFFVDEFQDVNPLQHALLESWRGGRPDLCVVGDPRQAIYGWNGADPGLLRDIERTYPGVRIIRLTRNYRCSPGVIDAAAGVLAADDGADDTEAVRPPVGEVSLRSAVDETAEADLVAEWLRRHRVPGGRWRAMAVLARTNIQLETLAAAFVRRGIPVELAARPAADPDDAARRSLLAEARRLTAPSELAVWGRDLDEGFGDGVSASPLHRRLAAAVQRFLASMQGGTGPAFVEWLELTGGGDFADRTPTDAVALLTFHAAKGREWRTVAVTGVEPGLVPHGGAHTTEAKAEELRLLYVAITRASDHLLITWADERNRREAGRSPLLDRVETALAPVPLDALPLVGRRPRRPVPADDPVLCGLRTWRQRAATAAGLPPRAIVDDRTLEAIAVARPATLEELGTVPGMSSLAVARLGPRLLGALAGL